MVNNQPKILKRGSLTRGRFRKFFEEKPNGQVRYWGMCDVTAGTYEIVISGEVFFGFLKCYENRSYKDMSGVISELNINERRFLVDGLSPRGWEEIKLCLDTLGIEDHLLFQGLRISRIFQKPKPN